MGAPTFLELARSIDRQLAGNVNWPFRALVNGASAITDNDFYLTVDAALGAATLTLPSAVTVKKGLGFRIMRIDSVPANAVTINTTGGQTINGGASATITAQYSVLDIVSDGANWLLFASPAAFAIPTNVLWTFPNTVSNDQNAGLFTYVAVQTQSFAGFDLKMNAAPTGQDLIVDWEVNGVIDPALRVTLPAGDDYVELLVPVSLAAGDTLKPTIPQVGTLQPGQTMALRARGV